MSESNFNFGKKFDKLLKTLEKIYDSKNEMVKRSIIVSARHEIIEGVNYDNWNGGQHGHNIIFHLPEEMYLKFWDNKEIRKVIKEDINTLNNIEDEFVNDVLFEMEMDFSDQKQVTSQDTERIWGKGFFKLFISHKYDNRFYATDLKKYLESYGISCFVAHSDINPTQEWQNEIENALFSMDALLALLCKEFSESKWTDQEIGFALGQKKLVIPIDMGKVPYGFFGKYQGIKTKNNYSEDSESIIKILINRFGGEKFKDGFSAKLKESEDWYHAERIGKKLFSFDSFSEKQILNMIDAYNSNSDVRGSFFFSPESPGWYKERQCSLLSFVNSKSEKHYKYDHNRKIVPENEDEDDLPF